LLSPTPVAWWVLKRLGAQWLITLLPLLLLSPLAALMLNLPGAALGVLLASLVLGTPVLVWLAGFAAALTVQVHRAGALLPLLVLPLMVPVLIFGTSAVRAAQAGQDPSAALLLLAAMSLAATTLMPFAIAGVLKGGR
jgi:heme exporter protein B